MDTHGCSAGCGCSSPLARRDFLKALSAGVAAISAAPWEAMAGPFTPADFDKLVPADKKLAPQWVNSLFQRGSRTVYRGADLAKIGMPVGGLCCGQVYLGGDGRLWHWDIFNQHVDSGSSGPHYANPLSPASPFDQGFALRLHEGNQQITRNLDRSGWSDISFAGEYPIGSVQYRDAALPVSVSLESFSPFIPLNEDDSALPVTVMRFTVKNLSSQAVDAELLGWLQNAACLTSGETYPGNRSNRIVRNSDFTAIECTASALNPFPRDKERDDILFEDFESDTYGNWTATGEAFGKGPVTEAQVPSYQGKLKIHGSRAANSHASAPGTSVEQRDSATGSLLSKPFTLARDYITFLIGGGAHQGRTCMNLLVQRKAVLTATGRNSNEMELHTWDVRRWLGREAQLQIVDNEKGGWGNIGVDHIVFTHRPASPARPLTQQPDFGSMALALLPEPKRGRKSSRQPLPDWACAALAESDLRSADSPDLNDPFATKPFDEKLTGSIARRLRLAPDTSATVTFLVTWYFPNLKLTGLGEHQGRWYGRKFASALGVAEYVARNFDRLYGTTQLWHQTWYRSSLPFWFLDRTFLNTSILASSTCYWLGNNRFYAWEGVGCCAGTCAHVWHYAQAVGRLFPAFERRLREQVDFDIAFDADTGRIRFRAEHNDQWAVDSQAGVILRTLREHQVSANDDFLRSVWPKAKKALQFLIEKDQGRDGIVDGPQHNTLDTDWWGEIAWLSGLYLAALKAGTALAQDVGDRVFEKQCAALFERGVEHFTARLFNNEYFINLVDPRHLDTINSGSGCEIDQVLGQSWAFQVGLGRVLPEQETRTALRSLWRYNFSPDVGPYRAVHKPGRWYAMPGEAGLLMCSFPCADWDYSKAAGKGPDWAAGYFNECMNGFEYQVAGHMLWEGLLTEGMAITRAVHDRYHASRRNPWNEIECGDHYARSMASYGVFLAACGFEYDGPKGHIGFDPRIIPEDFRAAFTAAEGWGSFSQKVSPTKHWGLLELKYGSIRLRSLSLGTGSYATRTKARVRIGGKRIPCAFTMQAGKAHIMFERPMNIKAGQRLEVELL